MNGAVVLVVRAGWRRRLGAIVGLALLAGAAGAFVLTGAAGSRRSGSSFDRMVADARSGDTALDVGNLRPDVVRRITELPMVEESGAFSIVFAVVEGVDEDLGLWVPRDERLGTTIDRDRVVAGRRPDPGRADEVALNEIAAELTGLWAGDQVTIFTLTSEQVAAEEYYPPRGPELHLDVVGVTRGPGDLVARGEGAFIASPALAASVVGKADVFTTIVSVRLADGTTAADFDEAVQAVVPPDAELGTIPLGVRAKPAQDAVAALGAGLAVFAAVAAVAGVFVVGQTVGRHVSTMAADQPALAALGMSRRQRRGALVLAVAPIAIGGAVVAVLGAVLGSAVMPIGLARQAEPDPGIDVDGVVLGLGALGVVLLVLSAGVLAAGWHARRASQARSMSPTPSSTSIAARAALRSGAGPVAAVGASLALDRRPPSLPVRSAIVGLTAAVAGIIGVLTFSSSLDRLVTTPARWGHPWDLSIDFTSGEVDAGVDALVEDRQLGAVARWDAGFSYVFGEGLRAFGLRPLRGELGFALRSGRQPANDDEVVVGPDTADRLGLEPGDIVEVAKGVEEDAATVRVVGTALFPEIDEGNFTDAVGFFGDGFEAHAIVPDLFEASQVVVRYAEGADGAAVRARLAQQYPEGIQPENAAPPGSVATLARLRSLPRWLAVFVAALGLASLTHALLTTVRRRRRMLATVRSLGCTRPQAAGCLVWQAVFIGAVGLVAGIPLGLTLGRAAWWAVADPAGVSAAIRRPWLGLVVVCVGAVAAATVLAGSLGLATGRRSPAEALRTE